MIHFKDGKNKSSALTTRWAQMSKQEQIIERKKMEIQAKLEAQKQAAALAAQAKLINPSAKEEKGSNNIFSNDGSFMSQYKALIEKQKKEKEEKEQKERQEALEAEKINIIEAKSEVQRSDDHGSNDNQSSNNDRKSKDRQRRWGDRGKNRSHSPTTPAIEDRKKIIDQKNIPSLMQIPVMPPEPPSPNNNQWSNDDSNDPNDSEQNNQSNSSSVPDSSMMPGPIGPGPMGFGPMGPGMMGPGIMGPGPGHMGPGPGPMGPGPGSVGPGPMGNRFMGPGGNGPMPNNGPNIGPRPMMGCGGPMPPFMGGPPNFQMPPNFMGPNGPNGPGGPCGPGPLPPNLCGPNMRGPGPNGPMPPFFPPFPNPQMMRPNGPPNSMLPPNSMMPPNSLGDNNNQNNMPFMGPRPPFVPNCPNFGPGGPNGNGPPMPFMPPNVMPPNNMPGNLQGIPEPKPLEAGSIPPPEPMKLQSIPSPSPLQLNHIPQPKDMEPGNLPPPNSLQVFSADRMPPPVHRAAIEVATNGDQWENVLKAIHSQDQNMWFLHNPNSNEYKSFRNLVNKIRNEGPGSIKPEVKPEDKYEPEFCLEDDDSNDSKPIKQETFSNYQESTHNNTYSANIKAEHTSSQSDDDSEVKRERRKRKKSRWGDDPPVTDIKPPGVLVPNTLPPALPGAKLAKIDENGLKLTSLNKNNPALMQYAMTNYGTTNLSPEDWAKCEDNFKLNLLYQDMLKKREEVERLNAAGRNKYEYDSDEDTSEGTWEHRLRAKEMCATERWADELTKQAAGKHHIGDFLPPEELRKFMEKYSGAKGGKEPDLSDYKEYKLKEDNVGFKMLQKLGWNEGQGLGAEGTGIVDPINKANQPVANMGLGAGTSDAVSPDDDEFDAYRKRMMLAYRFRPNPLNNPRRPYY
ncbi:uncharacterized protein LOC119839588 isoform X2 [Zerene cesonia]|uniref:uncharacterized protein LOC119839588 isoform X2 n=1 Tax=Zerene cesonia TaxID=33412 RepID=UPI0018E577BC|nr:uncharacterized protein LOC119839588 isoform X2 [Zerene cesonia]